MKTRCGANTAAGRPCRAWAVRGTDPPRCASHGGARGRPGAPKGNGNAVTHGAYEKDDLAGGIAVHVQDLDRRIAKLGAYIDEREEEPGFELAGHLDLLSKMMGRVTRMRQVQARMGGSASQNLRKAVGLVLDEMGCALGVDL